MRVHKSELYHMRGSGVGSIFSSIFRTLIPIASTMFGMGKQVLETKTGQKVLEAVRKPALQAGLDIAKDALDGENVVKAIKRHGKKAGKAAFANATRGSGRKRKTAAPPAAAAGVGGGGGKKKKKKAAAAASASAAKSLLSELGL